MKQLPFLAIFLSLLAGIVACAPTAAPTQVESPNNTRTEQSKEPAAATQALAPDQAQIPDSAKALMPIANTEAPSDWDDSQCDSTATATQQAMNLCALARYQRADEQLNGISQTLKRDLSSSGQQALTTAELAWIEFRDRNCTFAKNQFIGGSIAPLIYNSCLKTHTEARLTELQQAQLPTISYPAADTQLNETYQDLLAILSGPETEDMTDIQLAWIEFRDRNCTFETLYSTDAIEKSQCLARMSEARTAQLEQNIDQRSL